MSGTEITFEVSEDEVDGGYSASALGFGIHTEGETLDEPRRIERWRNSGRAGLRTVEAGGRPSSLYSPSRSVGCVREEAA